MKRNISFQGNFSGNLRHMLIVREEQISGKLKSTHELGARLNQSVLYWTDDACVTWMFDWHVATSGSTVVSASSSRSPIHFNICSIIASGRSRRQHSSANSSPLSGAAHSKQNIFSSYHPLIASIASSELC